MVISAHGHPSKLALYSGLDFKAAVAWRDVPLLALDDGLYLMDDRGSERFDTGVVLPESYLGDQNSKRCGKARFYGTGGCTLQATVDGQSGETFEADDAGMIFLRHGLLGRKWMFRVAGFDTLDLLEIFVQRRAR